MSVYVDDMAAKVGRMKMCHMIADTSAELLAMADVLGIDRKWIQYPFTYKEHFDICLSKRATAVKAGAVQVSMKELARILMKRRPAA